MWCETRELDPALTEKRDGVADCWVRIQGEDVAKEVVPDPRLKQAIAESLIGVERLHSGGEVGEFGGVDQFRSLSSKTLKVCENKLTDLKSKSFPTLGSRRCP